MSSRFQEPIPSEYGYQTVVMGPIYEPKPQPKQEPLNAHDVCKRYGWTFDDIVTAQGYEFPKAIGFIDTRNNGRVGVYQREAVENWERMILTFAAKIPKR